MFDMEISILIKKDFLDFMVRIMPKNKCKNKRIFCLIMIPPYSYMIWKYQFWDNFQIQEYLLSKISRPIWV